MKKEEQVRQLTQQELLETNGGLTIVPGDSPRNPDRPMGPLNDEPTTIEPTMLGMGENFTDQPMM